jgi:hypothetical protein
VRQLFEAMVKAVKGKQFDAFVCIAGVLTHYVGDACQPLHISMYHHGDPADFIVKTKTDPDTGKVKKTRVAVAEKVHDVYETQMVSDPENRANILKGLARTPKVKSAELIQTGQDAAEAVVALMRSTIGKLPPIKLVQALNAGKGNYPSLAKAFYAKFGAKTIKVMQDGTHLLAVLWESAWILGKGESNVTSLASIGEPAAKNFYQNPNNVPSCYISEIVAQFGV